MKPRERAREGLAARKLRPGSSRTLGSFRLEQISAAGRANCVALGRDRLGIPTELATASVEVNSDGIYVASPAPGALNHLTGVRSAPFGALPHQF
jgi:hypothetical protein